MIGPPARAHSREGMGLCSVVSSLHSATSRRINNVKLRMQSDVAYYNIVPRSLELLARVAHLGHTGPSRGAASEHIKHT